MKKWQKIQLLNLTALLLGISLTFAFAPYEIFPLAIIAPAGLLALWLQASPKRAFWLGFLFGLGFFGAGVYWVFISVHVFGGVPSFLATIITSGLIAYLASFPAIHGYLLNRFFPTNNEAKLVCAFPAFWVLIEWVRSWLFTGFPWLILGYSQTNSPLKGYAPILSVYGVSLSILMISALSVIGVIKFKQKNYRSLYFSLLAIGIILISGSFLNLIPWTKPIGNPIQISLVQGAIPQEIKWSPENLQLSFDRYQQLTEPLWGKNKLIIWPETAIPMPLQDITGFVNDLNEKAKDSNTQLIMGIPIQAEHSNGFYNAVVTVGDEKKLYLKRHLVPFGEYVPMTKILDRILNSMDIPTSNLLPGDMLQPPLQLGNIKILTSICYEIAFPELIHTTDKTINLLLTVTNDAWFGKSAAQSQHLQMAEMRALELKRPVLMVSNDGITAIIGPDGKIESAAPPYQPFVLTGTVQPTIGLTPWMRNGMDPVLFLILVLLFVAVRSKKRLTINTEPNQSTLPVNEDILIKANEERTQQ